MKVRFFVLLVPAIFIISGCSNTENFNKPPTATTPAAKATATPDEFASVRAVYAKDCVACHGAQGEGGLKTVDDKKLKVPSLSEGHALKHTDEDFVKQIEKGGDGMPAFKDKISPEEIELLVRLIRREFQGK